MPPSFLRLVLELPEVLLPRGEFAHDLVARWVAVEDAETVNVSTCEREEEQRECVSRAWTYDCAMLLIKSRECLQANSAMRCESMRRACHWLVFTLFRSIDTSPSSRLIQMLLSKSLQIAVTKLRVARA